MFKMLILMAGIVFSTASHGVGGIPTVARWVERGAYAQAGALANKLGIPFSDISEHVSCFTSRLKLGGEMGLSFDEIEAEGGGSRL